MPRKIKILPDDRAQWSFGGLVYWHLFIQGTRPEGKPEDEIGQLWSPKEAMDALNIRARGFWNWIDDDHLPYDTVALERVLFGNSPLFNTERLELQQKLRATRAANVEQARLRKDPKPTAGSLVPVARNEADEGQTENDQPGSFEIVEWRTSDENGFSHGDDNDGARENFGKVTVIPPEVFRARPGVRHIRRGPILVAGMALLIGAYAWTRIPPVTSGPNTSFTGTKGPGGTAENEKEAKRKAQAEAERLEAERLVREAADRQRETDETRIAEERRKADEVQARVNAEQKYQVSATKDAVEQKRIGDLANAQALNAKLKVLAQADGNDLCKQKLEGLSVPGFTLKCDTQIPFGLLLGAVSVSQTASSLEDCAARCRKVVQPRCVAFSFDAGAHTGAASCYLTGSIPGYTPATNWIAGTR